MPDEAESANNSRLAYWRDLLISAFAASLVMMGLIYKIQALHQHGFPSLAWFSTLAVAMFYLMVFVLFVIRFKAKESLGSVKHWIFALGGTWLPLLIRVEQQPVPMLFWVALPLLLMGIGISLVAVYHLGRSFGVLAANREVKTSGLYGFIRHPLYTGEFLWLVAVVLQNLNLFNIALLLVQLLSQIVRMRDEEALLQRDAQYADYMSRVRYRMIPGVF